MRHDPRHQKTRLSTSQHVSARLSTSQHVSARLNMSHVCIRTSRSHAAAFCASPARAQALATAPTVSVLAPWPPPELELSERTLRTRRASGNPQGGRRGGELCKLRRGKATEVDIGVRHWPKSKTTPSHLCVGGGTLAAKNWQRTVYDAYLAEGACPCRILPARGRIESSLLPASSPGSAPPPPPAPGASSPCKPQRRPPRLGAGLG